MKIRGARLEIRSAWSPRWALGDLWLWLRRQVQADAYRSAAGPRWRIVLGPLDLSIVWPEGVDPFGWIARDDRRRPGGEGQRVTVEIRAEFDPAGLREFADRVAVAAYEAVLASAPPVGGDWP